MAVSKFRKFVWRVDLQLLLIVPTGALAILAINPGVDLLQSTVGTYFHEKTCINQSAL